MLENNHSLVSYSSPDEKIIVIADQEQYKGKDLGFFHGDGLWAHTDLFDTISTHVLDALSPKEHFAAILDMLDWCRTMKFQPSLSVIPPSNPNANNMWHARLTKMAWNNIKGWRYAENGNVCEWKSPYYPDQSSGEMWKYTLRGWARIIDPDRAKYDVNKIDRPGYGHLIKEALSLWLSRADAPVIVAQLERNFRSKRYVDCFDITRLLLNYDESAEAQETLSYAQDQQPQYLARVIFKMLNKPLPDEIYKNVSVSVYEPGDALMSQRIAQTLAEQTIAAGRPSGRRRL